MLRMRGSSAQPDETYHEKVTIMSAHIIHNTITQYKLYSSILEYTVSMDWTEKWLTWPVFH